MIQGNTLDVVNNFIKMKILSQFGMFFMEPYKFSSLTRFIGVQINIDRFRKSKVLISRDILKGADQELVQKSTKQPLAIKKSTEQEVADLKSTVNQLVERLDYESRKNKAQQMMINTLAKNVKPIDDRNTQNLSRKRQNMQMKALRAQNITDADEDTKELVELNPHRRKNRNEARKED